MRLLAKLALTLVLVFAAFLSPVLAESRIALVIGNSAYKFGALPNPRNDAELITRTLRGVGFEVISLLDADQVTMKKAMLEFGRKLRENNGVGLFYYAGHGVQIDGQNYMIPLGSNIKYSEEVPIQGVRFDEFLRTMERAESRINIAIFDACRNNPFKSSTRAVSRGLARVDAPTGTIVAYSTSPGDVALDGAETNSPYTKALARAMQTPGITIEDVFKKTRREVIAVTSKKQVPWESSSLTGDFYFKKPNRLTGNEKGGGANPSADLEYFEQVKSSKDIPILQSYLERFPDGLFAALIRHKISQLDLAAAKTKVAALAPNQAARE